MSWSWRSELEWESGRITLVGRRIVIVFSRGEVEKWRTAANCFLTGLTRLTGLGSSFGLPV